VSRIAGFVSRVPGWTPAPLDDFLARLAGSGWVRSTRSSGPASLGATGRRPPAVGDGSGVLVALDGSIYNLAALGDPAASPAETIAALYRQNGIEGTLRRLNGDFALALFDPGEATLFLARDRFGVKPLYYVTHSDYFAFASRPRPLLSLPGVRAELERQYLGLFAASHYRYFDNRPERSPFADVAQLPAAHVLAVRDGATRVTRYWTPVDGSELDEPEAALAERYRELLLDAVALRLRAAERPAFTLSGGMDSSSVLGSAVQLTGSRQHAFSAVYADDTFDESADIRPMLNHAVADWHPVQVGTPDVFGLVQRMVAAHDEPVATATWLSHYLVCEHAAELGFGSLFGGLGGDELNAGEYEHFFFHFADLQAAGRIHELEHEVERWIANHDHPLYRKSRAAVEDALSRLVDLSVPGRCLVDRARLERYADALDPELFDLRQFEPVMEHLFTSYLRNRAWQDLTRETTPCCLRAEDRQTAAFGLDHFDPFLDHRVVELMFRVPGTLKIRDGVTKRLLREAVADILPDETRLRVKKTGWNAPAHVWFSGPDREPLLDLVRSRRFRERGIYNLAEVERIVEEHDAIVKSGVRRENHMMFLWQLVNLETWLSGLERSE
jgi:asparagine synthase (glutamine-hydrolysing)